jgi:hypothetical protein
MKKIILLLVVAGMMLASCQSAGGEALIVNDVWARPASMGDNSAAYFLIDNQGTADKLIGAKSDIAMSTEVHMTMSEGGMMKMKHVMEIEIPSGEKTEFQPGGYHVMFMGLNRDLKPGDTFSLTLVFETAGEMTFEVVVREP